MTHKLLSMEGSPSSLQWGRCRFMASDDTNPRRRRRPTIPTGNQKLPRGSLLVQYQDGTWTLCRTHANSAFAWTDKVTLCFDESVKLVTNDCDKEAVLSILDPYLLAARFAIADASAAPDCPDPSHRHLSVIPKSPQKLDSGIIVSFDEAPAILLSMSMIRISEGKTTSPLEQACLKRQLVCCTLVFVDDKMTTEFSVPFQGQIVRFRVASVLPGPQKSRRQTNVLYIIMPSTRITLTESYKPECDESNRKALKPANSTSLKLSPCAALLIETIHCIRLAKSVNVPRAFLLTGPPGVGKTHSVRLAVEASESEGPTRLVSLQGSELLSTASHPAEASKALERQLREAARFCRNESHVGIVFLDECEALLSSDTIAAMFANLLDMVSCSSEEGWQRLVIVAATNRIDAVPTWLRRPGRLDREVALAPPDAASRVQIIKTLLKQSSLSSSELNDTELSFIAEACVGYVPADLASLVRRAALLAFQEQALQITSDLLQRAMSDVGASALRDAALSAPPMTTWDDIAGDAGGAKTALCRAVEWPRTKKHAYASLGLVPPRGILLHGPPGCAKTTLARAAAGTSGIAFFALSPADVYASSYVGEAEAVVRRAFTLARSAAPCILFFDEIDSILGSTNGGGHGMRRSSTSAEARVLSTFLNEMDGVDASQEDGVLVLGATNRPATLDAALLRPGRFDIIIYVPPPDEEGRKSMLEMQCHRWKCQTSETTEGTPYVDVNFLASDPVSGSMTGAEIMGACREAAMRALRTSMEGESKDLPLMKHVYLEEALRNVKPLLSNKLILEKYTRFKTQRS